MDNKDLINWLNKLVTLDEPKKHTQKVGKSMRNRPEDYRIGLYEGVTAMAKALSEALNGNIEELDDLIEQTINENLRHWENQLKNLLKSLDTGKYWQYTIINKR